MRVALPFVRRLREIFESIAYAGLQPGSRPGQSKLASRKGSSLGFIERLLSGGPAPSDPFYLTNRTMAQKAKIGVAIGIPCLALALVVYGMLTNRFRFGAPPPAHEPSASEMAAKLLPHMDQNLHIESNNDVEVVEVRVEHGSPPSLVGSMKNNTNHEIREAEAVFDLTDSGGSQVGGVSTKVENLKAGSTASFRFPIPQAGASFALVREVHAQ